MLCKIHMHDFKSRFQQSFLAYCTRPVSVHLVMASVGCSFNSFSVFFLGLKQQQFHSQCTVFVVQLWFIPSALCLQFSRGSFPVHCVCSSVMVHSQCTVFVVQSWFIPSALCLQFSRGSFPVHSICKIMVHSQCTVFVVLSWFIPSAQCLQFHHVSLPVHSVCSSIMFQSQLMVFLQNFRHVSVPVHGIFVELPPCFIPSEVFVVQTEFASCARLLESLLKALHSICSSPVLTAIARCRLSVKHGQPITWIITVVGVALFT